jgi:VWFA-related protein
MRALPLSLAFILIPLAHSADPGEVTIRSGPYYPQPPAISAESNLVESAVTVYDPQGRSFAGLSAADFVISDNAKPQRVTFFSELRRPVVATASTSANSPATASTSQARSLPQPTRSVALFFDDLHLSAVRLEETVLAARKLIGNGLPAGERMGIFTDSGTVTLDLTNDTSALLAALPRIKSHSDLGDHGIATCPTLTPYTAFVIAERIDLQLRERAVEEVMSPRCDAVDRKTAEGLVQDRAESVWENTSA